VAHRLSNAVADRPEDPIPDTGALFDWLRSRGDRGADAVLGKGYQAIAYHYRTPFGDVVVKRARPAIVLRTLGRLAIGHEHRIYRRLAGVPGVPRCYGLLDSERLVLEYVEGLPLRSCEDAISDRDLLFTRLRATIDAMHRVGVTHGDLKRKDNILIGHDERPWLIDFGVARLKRERDSRFRRWLYEWCRQSDYNAWIKLKYQRQATDMSAEDRAIFRPLILERIARAVRIPLRALTLRRLRKRLKRRQPTIG
jgi:predicted Ser/Thr protein kinase